ncbi:L-2-amino-thiazoline-4-carboxylic acid hydrolase [Candidatus Lokiarchaeum ossiferum]|uniref:L-2-amino-thiazoline-4-carboxylic acid hydrolase n=1 Tax=Candidatus Lokiarchaeum ossiferum TaxID=2951803 RepID=UPI00352F19B6
MPNSYSKLSLLGLHFQFWIFLHIQKQIITQYFSKDESQKIISDAKIEFKCLIPRIPFIGGKKNFFTQFLLKSALCIPIVKVLKKLQVSQSTIGEIIYKSSDRAFDIIQKPFKKKFQKSIFSYAQKEQMKQIATRPSCEIHPMDWKMTYEEEDPNDKNYSIIYSECGIVKFWKAENLQEFIPYMCLTDFIKWDNADLNVSRQFTLGNGGPYCDFHFHGFGTSGYRGWPPEKAEEWKHHTM